jgi:hypothetical protein
MKNFDSGICTKNGQEDRYFMGFPPMTDANVLQKLAGLGEEMT